MTTKHLTSVMCLTLCSAAAAELRITVYDAANLSQAEKRQVYDRLARILYRAGIEPKMIQGDMGSPEATYITAPGTSSAAEEQRARCRARRDIALNFRKAPSFLSAAILGISVPLAGEGLNARVFTDRVRANAAVQGLDFATVLAYASAHEIGHVLLRSALHEPAGLMGAVWTRTEYVNMRTVFLSFDKLTSEAMQATLAGEGCRTEIASVYTQMIRGERSGN